MLQFSHAYYDAVHLEKVTVGHGNIPQSCSFSTTPTAVNNKFGDIRYQAVIQPNHPPTMYINNALDEIRNTCLRRSRQLI